MEQDHPASVGKPILLLRHLVCIAAVASIQRGITESWWLKWGVMVGMAIVGGAVVAFMGWLFFTKTQRGKALENFINGMWCVILFAVCGSWVDVAPWVAIVPWTVLIVALLMRRAARKKRYVP